MKADESSFLATLERRTRENSLSPIIVLVGSNLLGIHLRHRLAERTGGHANVRFLTFIDLAERLTFQTFIDEGIRPFPSQAEQLLLEQLLSQLPSSHRFANVVEKEGFLRALQSTFHDLIDAGAGFLDGEKGKLKDILDLFDEHRRRYEARFVTTADMISAAAIDAHKFESIFGVKSLDVYGFYDFTQTQKNLLDRLQVNTWTPTFAPPTASVSGFSAPGEYVEAEEGVRYLLSELEKKRIPLHRVGILLRNPESYLDIFCDVLSRAGVPFYRGGGIPLSGTAQGQAFTELLSALGSEWSRPHLIAFLSRLQIKHETLKKIGTSADWDLWTRKALAAKGIEATAHKILRASSRLDPKAAHFAQFLFDLAKAIRRIETPPPSWKALGLELKSLFSEDDFLELFDNLQDLDDIGISPSLPRMKKVLAERFQKSKVSTGQLFGRDGVFVGSLVSARMIRFDLAFIPGLVERVFPAPPQIDPLLLDSERKYLNQKYRLGLSYKENRLKEEKALFDLALSKCDRKIVLSYSRRDPVTGQQTLPSSFFTRCVPETSVLNPPLAAWKRDLTLPLLDCRDWLSRDIGSEMLTKPKETFAFLSDASPLVKSSARWIKNRLATNRFTSYDGLVDVKKLSRSLTDILSANDIVMYATCPYRYFLAKVAKLSSVTRPEEVFQIHPMDRGNLIHKILFRLFTDFRSKNLLPLKADDLKLGLELLKEIAAKVFEEAEALVPLGHPLLWETERALLLADLKSLLEAEFDSGGYWIPLDFEVRFGMPSTSNEEGILSTDLPLSIPIASGEAKLRGKIDRIDVDPDRRRSRIIDYKTGTVESSSTDRFCGGKNVQLPIYLSALKLLLPQVDLFSSESQLLATSYGSGLEETGFSGAVLSAREKEFLTLLDVVFRGIQQGLFPPNPGRGMENCKRCDFTAVCSKAIGKIYEKKAEDPVLVPFLSLQEIE